jgi:hypothetical protein
LVVIVLLVQYGAQPHDTDAKGTTVEASAASGWVRQMLGAG